MNSYHAQRERDLSRSRRWLDLQFSSGTVAAAMSRTGATVADLVRESRGEYQSVEIRFYLRGTRRPSVMPRVRHLAEAVRSLLDEAGIEPA